MNYILSYDPFAANLNAAQLQAFIRDNRYVDAWYQPFAGTWIVKSRAQMALLSQSFRDFLGGAPFLLSQLSIEAVDGSLQPNIWKWIVDPPAVTGVIDALSGLRIPGN